jgi:adenylate cyclase
MIRGEKMRSVTVCPSLMMLNRDLADRPGPVLRSRHSNRELTLARRSSRSSGADRMERRLAAIVVADVVGYSRLMQVAEASTLATLKARYMEIIEPLAANHHGRIVKLMGDGVLMEFASAVNAVECAVELQQAMAGKNGHTPDDRRIVLRIGINLGDVIVEGDDLFGDGVNVAARLESVAEPESVLVSEAVFRQVHGKVAFRFEDTGERRLKNIADPIRAYRVSVVPETTASTIPAARGRSARPSIAVLPIANLSPDPQQQHLSDGITEDLITELSRYRELLVIARNSSFQYRNFSDMKRVGRDLGAEYLVEGSLRKAGSRLRVTAQLIETETGTHLWAERYDRDLEDVFAIQDEVTQMIAATLVGRLIRSGPSIGRRTTTFSKRTIMPTDTS